MHLPVVGYAEASISEVTIRSNGKIQYELPS